MKTPRGIRQEKKEIINRMSACLFVLLILLLSCQTTAAENIDRANSISKFNKALRLSYQGKYDEALLIFKTLIADDPTYSHAYDLVEIYALRGRLAEGEHYLESLLQQNKENANLWHALARVSFLKKDYKKAIEYSKKCVYLLPSP
ncbi:MAG: tetratricopeptide repeat protein [Acidobacteria bacterium]|nr:tetratricopeptide repeat protein [Acidobacteriota bacterium]MBI3655520.1 tetratricopeptide repeat protein [Acidobacteriota bacterium]